MKKLVLVLCVLLAGVAMVAGAADKAPVLIGLQGPITGAWAYEGQMAKQSSRDRRRAHQPEGRHPRRQADPDRRGRRRGRAPDRRPGRHQDHRPQGRRRLGFLLRLLDLASRPPTSTRRSKMVNIAYGATAVRLTERGLKYFFRTCGRDDSQGKFFADFVPQKFGAKRIAIMHDNTAFGKGLAENARDALKPMVDSGKVQIVYYDAITPGEKDFHVPLTKMRETKPDVWYYTGYYAEAALLVTQAREIGITCPFVGGNAAINDEFVKIAGVDVAKGCYMTNEPLPGGPAHHGGGRVPEGLQGQVRRHPVQPVARLRGRRGEHHRLRHRQDRLHRRRPCSRTTSATR